MAHVLQTRHAFWDLSRWFAVGRRCKFTYQSEPKLNQICSFLWFDWQHQAVVWLGSGCCCWFLCPNQGYHRASDPTKPKFKSTMSSQKRLGYCEYSTSCQYFPPTLRWRRPTQSSEWLLLVVWLNRFNETPCGGLSSSLSFSWCISFGNSSVFNASYCAEGDREYKPLDRWWKEKMAGYQLWLDWDTGRIRQPYLLWPKIQSESRLKTVVLELHWTYLFFLDVKTGLWHEAQVRHHSNQGHIS